MSYKKRYSRAQQKWEIRQENKLLNYQRRQHLPNAVFLALIVEYHASSKRSKDNLRFKDAYNALFNAFNTLARHILMRYKFKLLEMEDIQQEMAMGCMEVVDKFDPNRAGFNGQESAKAANAFSYFTTVAINLARQQYNKELREIKKKLKYANKLSFDLNAKDRAHYLEDSNYFEWHD